MKKDAEAALKVLTGAALSLPGMVVNTTIADTVPDKHTASYRHTEYSEEAQGQFLGQGENEAGRERYEISVDQIQLSGPLTGKTGYSIGYSEESMSGASPIHVRPVDAEAGILDPIQVISGASITESRQDGHIGFDMYNKKSSWGVSTAFSTENDYESNSISGKYSRYLNDKNTTVNVSASFSSDTIQPTDGEIFSLRPINEEKQSTGFGLGFSQIVSKNLVLGASFNYAFYEGFLSDPYKEFYIENLSIANADGVLEAQGPAIIADIRPNEREQFAFNLQARRFFTDLNAALHTDYRFFNSSWGTDSSTVNVAWFQNFGKLQIIPRVRYYNQSSADFFSNYALSNIQADGTERLLFSSDFRLSAYEATSFRLKAQYDFGKWNVHGTYETYDSSSLDTDPLLDSPGLVNFSFFSLGANYSW